MKRSLIWSYGGGVQSVAIAVLVAQGKLPQPERIVIADTSREAQSTWRYLDNHVAPLLGKHHLTVEIASHDLATVDLRRGDKLLLPAYSLETGAPAPTWCSVEWKRRVVRRWLRQHGYSARRPVTIWLGISVDEYQRAKSSGVQWCEHAYPLLSLRLTRQDCLQLIAGAGLPQPDKSACWMCPFRNAEERATLSPGERMKADALDAQLRRNDGVTIYPPAEKGADGCDAGGYCWT